MCFEDADDKTVTCQEETYANARNPKTKRTVRHYEQQFGNQEHYASAYGDTFYGKYSTSSWVQMLQMLIIECWSWKYILLFMIAVVQLRFLQSSYATVSALFVLTGITLWMLRLVSFQGF